MTRHTVTKRIVNKRVYKSGSFILVEDQFNPQEEKSHNSGNLEISDSIGEGVFGDIFKLTNTETGMSFACKR